MKKPIFTALSLLLVIASYGQVWLQEMQSNGNVFTAKADFDQYWSNKTIEKGSGYKQFMRWYNFWEPRTFPTGEISDANPYGGFEEHKVIQQQQSMMKSANSPWTSIGPFNPGGGYEGIGRINVIEFHPTDPNTWFFGTPGGGLWKTTNAGGSWIPLTDQETALGVSDIAISTTNPDIMYIATGDRDGRDTYSFGILKSTDGGDTWSSTGLTNTVQNQWTTNRILLDPTNNDIVLVAAGDGIYRSTNGGVSFTQEHTGGYMINMEFKPGNSNVVYAAEYDYWNEDAGFYKSTDNGQSWTQITSGLPTSDCRRIHIGVSPADANYVYLIASDNDNGLKGIYRSNNSGTSFSTMATSPNVLHSGDGSGTGGQGYYDLALAVSPSNINELYVGGINMWKSTNGGSNWTKMTHWYNDGSTVMHADQHWYTFRGSDLFVGNDGGLYVTSDGANSFTEITNGTAITQLYRIGVDQNTNDRLVAGAQDNGTFRNNSGFWDNISGGDGMHCLIDYTDPNIVFASVQKGIIKRSTDGGNNFTDVSPDPGNGAWITPYEMDPSNHNIMYCGYDEIYKSTNNGQSWTPTTSGLTSSLLRHIQISKSNGNVVYCATYDQLWKSTDGGNNFTDVTGSLPVGNASISSICIDPTDENHVWVTFSGYSSGNKVFVTSNGGNSWGNQSGSLPNLPANILIYHEGSSGILYLGTDVGAYWWDPNNPGWAPYGTDLPNVIVMDMEIQYAEGEIKAATYGRGVWEIPLAPVAPPTANFTASATNVCQGESVTFSNLSLNGDTYEWVLDGATPSTSTDFEPTVTYNTPGSHNALLVVTNNNGVDSLEFLNYVMVEPDMLSTIPLGNATNLYTNIDNGTDPIVIDNELNTVIFLHRQNTNEHTGTSGNLRYDVSTDDGLTWSLDNGVLNPSAVVGTNDARYPQVNIYNPNGNTNPSNANLLFMAPTIGTGWNGYVTGDGNIGGTISENYNQGSPTNTYIPRGLVKGAPGEFWAVDVDYDGTNNNGLKVYKGTWSGSAVVWSLNTTFAPTFNTGQSGAPQINEWNIAFDETGQNGWVVMFTHLSTGPATYQLYPVFYQTTNGGTSWSGPIEIDLSTFTSITSNITGGGGGIPTTAFDVDLEVDASGNPHALFTVGEGDGTNYSIYPSEWMGACHLHYNGSSWEADILDDIQTLRYDFPNGGFMDNTPQMSIADNGNIIAFAWAESDPLLTGGDNSQPFAKILSYNVGTDTYSTIDTADICTLDPGQMWFLHVADRLMETSQGYELAAVISVINETGSELDETGHKFFSYAIPNVCSASADMVAGTTTACVNDNITFTDNSTNTGGYTYSWDVDNDGTTDYTTAGSISHSYTTPGIKTANLLLDDGSGCLVSHSVNITVNDLPNLNVTFPSTVCGVVQIDYTNGSSVISPATYDWDFDGDGNTDATTSGNQSYTPAGIGTLNGVLEVTDGNSCMNTFPLTVNVNTQPTADFTPPADGCAGDVLTFTDGSVDGTTYSWDMDNDGIEDYNITGDVSHVYGSAGLYTIELEVSNGGCNDSHFAQITIEDVPVAGFSILDQGNNSYFFIDQTTGGGTYQWNFGDGNTSTTPGNVSHTYADENAYTVTLTVTNDCGTDVHTEEINPGSSSIEDEKLSSINIYPNPTDGLLYINIGEHTELRYEMFDHTGRIVQRGILNALISTVDLSESAQGIYHLRLENEHFSMTQKIVIKK